MRYYIIQKDDIKSKKWAEYFPDEYRLVFSPGSAIKAPFFLLKFLFTKGRPNGYIVRYLNDYSSFFRTLIRLLSELFLVFLCLVLRVEVYWINHNADKETDRHHPGISNLRRWLFSAVGKKIFVTDEMLVPFVRSIFPKFKHKVQSVSFGRVPISEEHDENAVATAEEHIVTQRDVALSKGLKPLVLFCAGSPGNPKYLHFELVTVLIEKSLKEGFYIIPIMAGKFGATEQGKRMLSSYVTFPQILTFSKYTKFSSAFVTEYVDFYWRVYDDWSVPFSIYEAATFSKPTLTQRYGFLPKLIGAEGVGYVIENDWSNLYAGLQFVDQRLDGYLVYRDFFKTRDWGALRRRLLDNNA